MAYWWVNQNQTWKHEIGGGYLWSPKRSKDNRYNQFYENMRLAESGDIVFSYYGQRIQHVGAVQRSAISASKPTEFGLTSDYWHNEGWFIPVRWSALESPFRPKEIVELLAPHLPEKYSPLDKSGDGLQSVYLASVPETMANVLLQHLNGQALTKDVLEGDGEEAIAALDDQVERAIKNDTQIDETVRRAVISARRGQGRFRANLEEVERGCRVTGVTDRRLLRASHIKPWRSCASNHERLDGYNGLLLAPHADLLFDRGYISFTDDGELLVSPRVSPSELSLMGISTHPPRSVGSFYDAQRVYLGHHREQVFRWK